MQRPNAIERVIDKLDFGHDRFVSTDRGDKEGCWFPQWVVFNKKKDKARGGRIGRYRWFMNFGAPGPISAFPADPGVWWDRGDVCDSLYLGLVYVKRYHKQGA